MGHRSLSGGGGHHHHHGGGGWRGGGPGWGWGPQTVFIDPYPDVVAVPMIAAPAPVVAPAPAPAAPSSLTARANAFLKTPLGMASLGLAAYLLFFRKGGV